MPATSGNEALQLALEHDFALILLDVQMPDMDGFETAELLRVNPRTRHVPIIFVTAISREQKHIFQGYEAGAVDYIAKPIEPTILQSKVRVFCQLYRQRLELEQRRAELARANQELSAKNRQLEEELELARRIQLGFLPKTFPRKDRIAFGNEYLICTTLGGDLYDVFTIGNQHVGMYMADVSGHGVSAALISSMLRMTVSMMRSGSGNSANQDLLRPDQILAALNEILLEEIPEDRFITMIYAVLDLSSNVLSLASAGHPDPVHYPPGTGSPAFCKAPTGPALGLTRGDFPLTSFELQIDDKVLFYTDGLTEAMNAELEQFGDDRLIGVLREHGAAPAADVVTSIVRAVDAYRDGHEVSDDCSLLIIELKQRSG